MSPLMVSSFTAFLLYLFSSLLGLPFTGFLFDGYPLYGVYNYISFCFIGSPVTYFFLNSFPPLLSSLLLNFLLTGSPVYWISLFILFLFNYFHNFIIFPLLFILYFFCFYIFFFFLLAFLLPFPPYSDYPLYWFSLFTDFPVNDFPLYWLSLCRIWPLIFLFTGFTFDRFPILPVCHFTGFPHHGFIKNFCLYCIVLYDMVFFWTDFPFYGFAQ